MNDQSKITSYEEALSFLSSFQNIEKEQGDGEGDPTFDLHDMRRAVVALDHPQEAFWPVLVAGTKGKGSVCSLLESYLYGSGHSVGCFLSPHLRELRERIRVNRERVSRETFAAALDRCRNGLEEFEETVELTYFEWLTLMAFEQFRRENVDASVLEVGMGGRLDATNVVHPELSVITSLGKDHESFLGETIEEIAAEKAGVMRGGVTTVTTAKEGRGLDVLREHAEKHATPLDVLGETFFIRDRVPQKGSGTGQKVVVGVSSGEELELHLPVPGRAQAENLAAAVQAYHRLCEMDLGQWNPGIIGSASRQLSLPGRFQTISRRPPVILDAAHNPLSCRALVDALEETSMSAPRHLLFGVAADKDWQSMLRILAPAFDRIVLTTHDHPRAENAEEMEQWAKQEIDGTEWGVQSTAADVVRKHLDREGSEEPLIVAGSFYLIGEVLNAL